MGSPLPRILDTQDDSLPPLSLLELRNPRPLRVDLKGLIALKSSSLLTFKPFRLSSKCHGSPCKKQKLQICFHPQRVRRLNRKQIEKGILPTSLASRSSSAQVLSYFEERKIRKREHSVKVESPRGFCMFLSRQERMEFSVFTELLLRSSIEMTLLPQDLEHRVRGALQDFEDLSGLRKLGFRGRVGIPRREEYLRDFLAVRWFPDDARKQRMIEKQASEHKPRMTFTR